MNEYEYTGPNLEFEEEFRNNFNELFGNFIENVVADILEYSMINDALRISSDDNELKRKNDVKVVLEKVKFNEEEPVQCEICQEDIKKGDTTCNLECFHKFHFDCLYEWIHYKKNCPLCRTIII